MPNKSTSASTTTPVAGREADSLDSQVHATLQGSWLGMFLTELFEGVGQLALFLLLLEAIWEGSASWVKPDVYVLLVMALGLGPLLFYQALDLKGTSWLQGVAGFFDSAPHTFLLALAITQVGALISIALVARRHKIVIAELLQQLKTLSRWGFGSRVVEAVLRDSGAQAASRVERSIGFIDVRGLTAWSETHAPEEVIGMLNRFYAAVLRACADRLIKSKMSGDEVLLVLAADGWALPTMQAALRAAMDAMEPWQLSAGAGLWSGPVVEGFFGAQEAQVHDVIGDTVNTAKRLCDNAPAGQLLAGPLASLPDNEAPTKSIQAKGKQQPVQAAIYPAGQGRL